MVRKKRGKGKLLDTTLGVRLTKEEKRKLRALARKMGMTPSKLIRWLILEKLGEVEGNCDAG